jgi:hypothetical protein
LISDLIRAEDDDDRLTHGELLMLAATLLGAGTDTTRTQLAAAVQVLCEHSTTARLDITREVFDYGDHNRTDPDTRSAVAGAAGPVQHLPPGIEPGFDRVTPTQKHVVDYSCHAGRRLRHWGRR